MNPWRWVDPRIQRVRLEGVKAYLSGQGWTQTPNPNPRLLRFERPSANGPSLFQMIPSSNDLSDFPQSITYFITTMSEVEDRHPVEVLIDILEIQADESNRVHLATVGDQAKGNRL